MKSENPKPDEWTTRTWTRVVEALLVGAVAVLLYLPALDAPFVFDDLHIIQANEYVREGGFARIFSTSYWDGYDIALGEQQALYRPLTVLSYAWNWAAVGDDPAGFRIVNLLLHGITSMLVLALLRRLLHSRVAALAGALLFAVHPVHTEAVTYISGRADILAALFFFAAWWLHLRMSASAKMARLWLCAASWLLFGAGLLAKEMAATLPAVLLLFDGIEGLRAGTGSVRPRWAYAGHFVVLALFLFARGTVLGALVPQSSDIPLQANPLRDLSFVERFDDAAGLLGRELVLLVYPARLSIDYSYDAIPVSAQLFATATLPWALLALVAFAAALVALFRRRALRLAAALLFFFGTLFPVSNLAFLIGTNLGERVLYLVSFALSLCVASSVCWSMSKGRHFARAALGLSALVLVLFSGRTLARNRDYHSGYRLFETAKDEYPRASRAQFNFGVYAAERSAELARAGSGEAAQVELLKAEGAYARAVAIDPNYVEAHYEIARLAQMRGDTKLALEEFEFVLKSGAFATALPGSAIAYADCCLAQGEAERGLQVLQRYVKGLPQLRWESALAQGLLLAATGANAAAKTQFELAREAPDSARNHALRLRATVELALSSGDYADALAQFQAALALQPGDAAARQGLVQLGTELVRKAAAERLIEEDALALWRIAEAALRAALEAGARSPGLQLDYFRSLQGLGRWREAAAGFEGVASRRGPRASEASAWAGACHAANGDLLRARAAYALALELDPNSAAARRGLAELEKSD